ncbi:Transposable element Tcb2 transposase [Anthophora plagiata]
MKNGTVLCRLQCKPNHVVLTIVKKKNMEKEQNLLDAVGNMPVQECDVVFQHDNAPSHSAKTVKNWLDAQQFQTIAWPAQSPDLNPIENVWAYLKMKLANEYSAPAATINDLWERVQQQWYSITPDYCENIISSMPKRIQATIKAKGMWTKY